MPFHLNGYSNFHDLNLDFILAEIANMEKEIEKVKSLSVDMETLKEEYNILIAKYDQLEEDFTRFKEDVNSQFAMLSSQLRADLNAQMNAIRNEIRAFENSVNYQMDGFNAALATMNRRLDDALANLSDSIRIFNPFTGVLEPISQVIQMLASFHMNDALTAGEYDAMNLTAAAYDAKHLSAYQYDVMGKNYLP